MMVTLVPWQEIAAYKVCDAILPPETASRRGEIAAVQANSRDAPLVRSGCAVGDQAMNWGNF
jgi:hypothetical protein